MTYQNQHYIFGGESNKKQILQITGCSLTNIGTLAFNFRHGACANVDDNSVYLCFSIAGGNEYRLCRFSTSPTGTFEKTDLSYEQHYMTRIGSNKDHILAIGAGYQHDKVEMLSTAHNTWEELGDYPYGEKNLFLAPIVHIDGSFYVVGGRTARLPYETTIAKLDANSREWSRVGDLSSGRRAHAAIFDGTYLIVVGGQVDDSDDSGAQSQPTERCSIASDEVTCVEQSPSLHGYEIYPELFLVQHDFCKP